MFRPYSVRVAAAVAAVTAAVSGASAQDPVAAPVVPAIVEDAPPQAPAAAPAPAADCPTCCGPFDFKKVPPVRTFPRQGFFAIPPAGCGSYSLLAAWQGRVTDGPPKFGYPAFGLMAPGFYDADWRYLDDPKTPPQNRLDELKRIHLGDHWLVSTGGSAWSRYMNEYNSRLGQTDNVYNLSRGRVYADVWYEDRFRLYGEGIFAYSNWQDLPPLPIDQNKGDFLNLFLDAKLGEVAGQPVYLRAGRQELLLGSQRLVTSLDWANTRRTFQGFRGFRQSEHFDLDFFWVQPVIPNANNLDSVDNNVNFAGAWATYKPRKGTAADLYYLMLDNTNTIAQQGIARAPYTLHTIGGRYAGDVDGKYLWDFEAAMQLGTLRGQDVIAGMATAGLGYHSKDLPWNPTVWAYYDYASGDDAPNAGTVHTFNQLFAFGHYYMGWADLVARQNIHDVNAHLYLYPTKWTTLWLQYHSFWLASSRDALYNAAGVATRRDATGAAGNRVGNEVDAVVNFHLTPRADVLVGYSYLFGGNFLKATSGPNAAANASVFFVQSGFRW